MEVFQEQLKKLDGFYTKVLESMESKKKSPYELDLEVMDRKPDITPKEGDWVKIKSKEWYEKWKDSYGNVPVYFDFIEEMKEHCGRIYKVKSILSSEYFYVDELEYAWSMEMFEKVYPQEEYTILNKSGGDHIIIGKKPVMEATHSKEGRIPSGILPKDNPFKREQQLLKEQVFSKDITATIPTIGELGKSITGWNLDSSLLFPALPKQSAQVYIPKSLWLNNFSSLSKPETKLRIIKTNQLIKIEKL